MLHAHKTLCTDRIRVVGKVFCDQLYNVDHIKRADFYLYTLCNYKGHDIGLKKSPPPFTRTIPILIYGTLLLEVVMVVFTHR